MAGQPPPHAERGSSYFAHLAAGMMGHVRAWEAAWEVRQPWGDEAAAREATAREEQAEGAGTEGAEASGGGGYAFVLEDDAVRTPHFGRPLPCWLKVFATLLDATAPSAPPGAPRGSGRSHAAPERRLSSLEACGGLRKLRWRQG